MAINCQLDPAPMAIFMIKKEKITRFITCGYDLESSKKAINIAQKYDCTFATWAISPNDIPQSEEELWKELEEIKKIAKQKKTQTWPVGANNK